MSVMELIPFTSDGARQFFCSFVNGIARKYLFKSSYNYKNRSWTMDLYDDAQKPLVFGKALVPGVNLFEGNEHLTRTVGNLRVIDLKGDQARSSDTLGSSSNSKTVVVLFPPGEFEAVEELVTAGEPKDLNFDLIEQGYVIT